MRQSPTKVVFQYPTQKPEAPLYTPQLIHSGYIVGEPVAYTDHPQLPPNYHSFSPKQRPRATTSYPLNQSSHYHEPFQSKYEAPDPSLFARPQRQSFRGSTSRKMERESSVSIEQYNLLRQRYADLERKYGQLQEKYQRSINYSKGMGPDPSFGDKMTNLIEICKQNTMKQAHLLLQRYRLQSKEAQIDHIKK